VKSIRRSERNDSNLRCPYCRAEWPATPDPGGEISRPSTNPSGCGPAIGKMILFLLALHLAVRVTNQFGPGALVGSLVVGALVTTLVAICKRTVQLARTRKALRQRALWEAEYLRDLRERFGEMGANRIVSRELSQGDSTDMIREMFGEPDGVSTHVYKAKAQETWKYWRMGAHVYGLQIKIENDACVGWTTS